MIEGFNAKEGGVGMLKFISSFTSGSCRKNSVAFSYTKAEYIIFCVP